MKDIKSKNKLNKRTRTKRKNIKVKNKKIFEKKKENNLILFSRYFILVIKFLSLMIILYIIYYKIIHFYKQNKFCIDCSNNLNNINSKCMECSPEILFKGLYIASEEKTLKEIIKHKKSIARFSDGEYVLIFGNGISFQKYDKNLSRRLLEIINNKSKNKNLLVGIFVPYKKKELDLLNEHAIRFWNAHLSYNKFKLLKIINKKKKYYSTSITRFYSDLKDKSNVPKHIKLLKKIWENRDIIIVEGEKSRIGFGNDLFNNTKSIKRILCPVKHAFRVYDKILNAVLKISKDNLILIALGPTASVLAYDLSKLGYQAVDIGHADIQYELYLRNATNNIKIPYKYNNEFDRGKHVDDLKDANYLSQIIEKILY